MNIIQIYAPTADCADDEIENFYSDVKTIIRTTKKHEINILMGDFNAKVGKEKTLNVTGEFGLGKRNERGNRLIQFCQEEEYVISNTLYKLPERRLYTWKSPQDKADNVTRNQVDYIMINKRFKSSLINVKTYPGADVPSDHNLLMARVRIRLASNKIKRTRNQLNLANLDNTKIKEELKRQINYILVASNDVENPIDTWNKAVENIRATTNQQLGTNVKTAKQKWMNDEILKMMDERRKHRSNNTDEYKRLNKDIRHKIREARKVWMKKQCEDIERLEKLHDNFNLHKN